MPHKEVLIYGHSFISRLESGMKDLDCPILGDFDLEQITNRVEFIGHRGGKLARVTDDLFYVRSIQPKIIYLQILGNDISKTSDNVDVVISELFRIVSILAEIPSVQVIFIGQLLYRFPGKYYSVEESDQYQTNVRKANQLIKLECASVTGSRVRWWEWRGLKNPSFQVDGQRWGPSK